MGRNGTDQRVLGKMSRHNPRSWECVKKLPLDLPVTLNWRFGPLSLCLPLEPCAADPRGSFSSSAQAVDHLRQIHFRLT